MSSGVCTTSARVGCSCTDAVRAVLGTGQFLLDERHLAIPPSSDRDVIFPDGHLAVEELPPRVLIVGKRQPYPNAFACFDHCDQLIDRVTTCFGQHDLFQQIHVPMLTVSDAPARANFQVRHRRVRQATPGKSAKPRRAGFLVPRFREPLLRRPPPTRTLSRLRR